MITLNAKYKKLDTQQTNFLSGLLDVHGNIHALSVNTGLNRATIKRAAEGRGITEESYDAIVSYLSELEYQLNNNHE